MTANFSSVGNFSGLLYLSNISWGVCQTCSLTTVGDPYHSCLPTLRSSFPDSMAISQPDFVARPVVVNLASVASDFAKGPETVARLGLLRGSRQNACQSATTPWARLPRCLTSKDGGARCVPFKCSSKECSPTLTMSVTSLRPKNIYRHDRNSLRRVACAFQRATRGTCIATAIASVFSGATGSSYSHIIWLNHAPTVVARDNGQYRRHLPT